MKVNVSRRQLLGLDTEAEQMRNSLFGILLSSKLHQFYKDNGVHIASSKKKRDEIFKEFLEIDETGKLKTEMVENTPKVVLKEKIREMEFEAKMTELMEQVVAMEI